MFDLCTEKKIKMHGPKSKATQTNAQFSDLCCICFQMHGYVFIYNVYSPCTRVLLTQAHLQQEKCYYNRNLSDLTPQGHIHFLCKCRHTDNLEIAAYLSLCVTEETCNSNKSQSRAYRLPSCLHVCFVAISTVHCHCMLHLEQIQSHSLSTLCHLYILIMARGFCFF